MTRILRMSVAVLALALVATACGDDDAEPLFTTTTAAASSSTAGPTTTAATTTTTTTMATTTTAASTTTAPTTTTSTTTTTTAPPPPILFEPDGLGIAHFGDDPDVVIGLVSAIFGAAGFDSGWIVSGFTDYGVCPGSEYRRVEFGGGDLILQFSDAGYFGPEGVRQFFAFNWFGGAPGPTPGPPASIDAGTSVATLLSMWPGTLLFDDDPFFGDTFRYDGGGWNGLWGTLTGIADTDQIINITGGVGCGE